MKEIFLKIWYRENVTIPPDFAAASTAGLSGIAH
jgi:hypothetical protein